MLAPPATPVPNPKRLRFPKVEDGPDKVGRTIEVIRGLFQICPWTTQEIAEYFLSEEFARLDELPELYLEIESRLSEKGFVLTCCNGAESWSPWVEKFDVQERGQDESTDSGTVTTPLLMGAEPPESPASTRKKTPNEVEK